jgi:hypothetical protein
MECSRPEGRQVYAGSSFLRRVGWQEDGSVLRQFVFSRAGQQEGISATRSFFFLSVGLSRTADGQHTEASEFICTVLLWGPRPSLAGLTGLCSMVTPFQLGETPEFAKTNSLPGMKQCSVPNVLLE